MTKRTIKKAQSAMETVMLAGIILAALIPLAYYASGHLGYIGESKIGESLETVRSSTKTVASLGVGSSRQTVISLPKGIESYDWSDDKKTLNLDFSGKDISYTFALPILNQEGEGAIWPIVEGIHRLTLYNKGEYLLAWQCGNNIKEVDEQCDGTDKVLCDNACNTDCTCYCEEDSDCSNFGEECNEQTNSCIEVSICGDNVVSPALGEECDDGNTVSGDGCTSNCKREFCGDNVVQPNLGEECDDGNTINEDGCSSTCKDEECGDGILQTGLGEECDDGNTANNDGCSSVCILEPACNVQQTYSCGLGECDPLPNRVGTCTLNGGECGCLYLCNKGNECDGIEIGELCYPIGGKKGECNEACDCQRIGGGWGGR